MHSNTQQITTPTPTNATTTNRQCTISPRQQFTREASDCLKEIIKQRRRLIKAGTSKVHMYRHNKTAITIFEAYTWGNAEKLANFLLRHETDFREIIPGKNQKLKDRFEAVVTLANNFKPNTNEN